MAKTKAATTNGSAGVEAAEAAEQAFGNNAPDQKPEKTPKEKFKEAITGKKRNELQSLIHTTLNTFDESLYHHQMAKVNDKHKFPAKLPKPDEALDFIEVIVAEMRQAL